MANNEIHEILTGKEIAKREGISPRMIAIRWARNFPGVSYDCNLPLSPEQVAKLSRPAKGTKPAKEIVPAPAQVRIVPAVPVSPQPAPEIEDETTQTPPTWSTVRRFLFNTLLVGAVIGHAGLIWYDCATLWDTPGLIGGALVFIIVLAAVLVAYDSNLPRTSSQAMAFIFVVDVAAWWVHFPTFRTPIIDDTVTGVLCAFICACSFMALYLFRDSKLD